MIPAIEILFSAYIRDGVVFNQLIMFATTTFSALSLNVYCKCGVCAAYATSTHAKCRNVGVYVAAGKWSGGSGPVHTTATLCHTQYHFVRPPMFEEGGGQVRQLKSEKGEG